MRRKGTSLMPEDIQRLWEDPDQLCLDFQIQWQGHGPYWDTLSDRDLFAMYLGMSV